MCWYLNGLRRAISSGCTSPRRPQRVQRCIHGERIPEDHHVGDQAERPELIFLPLAVTLAQLSALPVEDAAGQTMAPLPPG